MKRLGLLAAGLVLCLAQAPAHGQDAEDHTTPQPQISLGEIQPTPEMWLYQQERARADDPQLARRRRAEQKKAQRVARLESQRWYGYSAARPMASPTPLTGTYSPYWSGNSANPFRWRTPSRSRVTVQQAWPVTSYGRW
jgi:hypothetical protein